MRSLAAYAIVSVLALVLVFPFIGGGAAAADTYTVSGKVVSGYGPTGPLDLPGNVTIQITNISTGITYETDVENDGTYSIGPVAGGMYEIVFTSTEKYGFLPITSDPDITRDTNGRYMLYVDDDTILDAAMVDAMGTIIGTVTRSGSPVPGVSIQVTDPSGKVIGSDRTDGNGMYSIKCPVGNGYTVAVSSAYFEELYYSVNLDIGDTITQNFEVTVGETATYLFGLDMTHSLMLVAGIMGMFLLIFVISYRIHIDKHPGSSKIHSDSKKKKDDD